MARKIIGMARRIDPTRGWPRRWRALVSLVVIVAASVVFMQTVFAVHEFFDLEGDVASNGLTDWEDLFEAGDPGGTTKTPLPAGIDHATLSRDFRRNANGSFNNADFTTYATGSKDTLPINPGWQCTRSNNVTDKDDIINAYVATFTNADDEDILYFGIERNARTGTANVGFWFLQGEISCDSPGGALAFSGTHQDGDLLIVSEFTNGGDVSTILVYRWEIPNPAVDPVGFLNPEPVAGSGGEDANVDCRGDLFPVSGDTICGAANRVPIAIPWITAEKTDGVGHSLREGEFFEGGLNLTRSGLGGKCFNTFLANTRSSTSLTANLFDYTQGTIGQCTSTTVTTPSITAPTIIDADGVMTVTDSAVVTVTGVDSFDGDVNFFLCGPSATQTLCTSGGVVAGTKNLTANGTVVSDTMTITEVGYYCWRAEFTGDTDAGVPASSDARASECFQILPRTPSLVTQAGTTPVDLGQAVTDTATLGNTANHQGSGGPAGSTDGSINPTVPGPSAGGTITFTLYKDGPGDTCGAVATGTGDNPQTVTVSGDNTYGAVSFIPDAPGTYHWVAGYSGDSPNTNPTSHNLLCNTANETVVVRQIPTEIKTKQDWIPNDTATIRSTVGNLAAGGSVVFSLYPNATCTGTASYTQTVAVPGGAPSAEVSTTNTTGFKILTGYTDPVSSTTGKYSWKIVYTPAAADTAHTGKQSACDAENFTITYTNDPGPGTNLP